MFENMTEGQARREILEAVAEYAKKFHEQKKEFHEGDRIPYASRVYDHAEMVNLVDSALEFWLTSGRYTEEFEDKDQLELQFLSSTGMILASSYSRLTAGLRVDTGDVATALTEGRTDDYLGRDPVTGLWGIP